MGFVMFGFVLALCITALARQRDVIRILAWASPERDLSKHDTPVTRWWIRIACGTGAILSATALCVADIKGRDISV